MVLFSLVASHSSIDLETVARLSAGAAAVSAEVISRENTVAGLITLATCNRYELYAHARSSEDIAPARSSLIESISRHSGLSESHVSQALLTLSTDAVPRHLFAVSTGLESAVVGEREIAGQVRRALSDAQERGTTTPSLVRLFQAAAKTAKDVGSQTSLGRRGMSIVSVALDLAVELQDVPTGSLAGKSAVLFGTGAYAGAAMAQLLQRGCTEISVYSPSGRAETFTASRGGTALNAQSLPQAVAQASLLLGCSGSDHQLSREDLAHMRHEDSQPHTRPGQLTVIDLALTHDFAPEVAELPGVDLLTLETVRQAAPAEQESTLAQASSLVAEATRNFAQSQNSRALDHAIVALRRHTMAVLDDEMAKVRKQHGCSAATEEVEFAMRRMVKQLLHIPTVRAKELAAAGDADSYVAALDALYGLKINPSAIGAAMNDRTDGEAAG
ncbi:glutamyl-tRNA reductase [Arthrobacter polaris]|uniref:glutamyl-tRNA reductase n=1 Tax=Arthrobacter polaris TaxID=2813727 RepID=UPI001F27C079|nr:glutamyl-tRNA reductase [Arthrobacter polaris]UIK87968.1 glutamyl-tRNA reductase [Arthrobacter polaris]